MEQSEKDRLLQAMHRLKKTPSNFFMMQGLSRTEFFVLHRLHYMEKEQNKEQPGIKTTDLSIAAEMSKPAVSQILNSLEDRGLIERFMTKSDRRVVFVRITQPGLEQLDKRKEQLNLLLDKVIRELGPQDTAELTRLFEKLHHITEKLEKEMEQNDSN
ncbi:MAG TPA: MarR family transcriptional regulator [Caproiciproducens sp.]|nr:MarR family transcriptional regulator [Caproiciproducens sp.]